MNQIHRLATHEDWARAWPVLRLLRRGLDRERFLASREELMADGYELFGLSSEGTLVSVAGLVFHAHVVRGSDCQLCDLATLEAERSKGFGRELVRFVARYAKDRGCARVCVHTFLDRDDTQRFYEERVGWKQCAAVFQKEF